MRRTLSAAGCLLAWRVVLLLRYDPPTPPLTCVRHAEDFLLESQVLQDGAELQTVFEMFM